MKRFFTYLLSLLFSINAFSQASLEGVVLDEDSLTLPFANIALYQYDTLVNGTSSDFDGYFFIDNIEKGEYQVRISYVGYKTKDLFISLENNISSIEFILDETIRISFCPWPARYFQWKQKHITIKDSDISELKVKKLDKIISTSPNVTLNQENEMSFKGSRPGSEQYIIDGMRVYGRANIATASIHSIKIYHNGVPARYGQTTSAVIDIRTNSYFDYFD